MTHVKSSVMTRLFTSAPGSPTHRLLPGPNAHLGTTTVADWLASRR
jgi:hypothetical protein